MASQQSQQQSPQPPQSVLDTVAPHTLTTNIARASSNAPSDYLANIRPTAFKANRVDGVASEPQPSSPVAALKATMVELNAAWQERLNNSERHNHDRSNTTETEHQREVAALKAENQSLKARLNHEEWTAPEQILNEDLRSVREENTKLRGREKNFLTSIRRADVRIKNDAARIAALEKELSDLRQYDASLTKDLRDLLAKHP